MLRAGPADAARGDPVTPLPGPTVGCHAPSSDRQAGHRRAVAGGRGRRRLVGGRHRAGVHAGRARRARVGVPGGDVRRQALLPQGAPRRLHPGRRRSAPFSTRAGPSAGGRAAGPPPRWRGCASVRGLSATALPVPRRGSLWGRGLTDRQWIEYGDFLGRLHRVTPSAEVAAVLPAETYRSSAGERLRTLGGQAATSEILGTFWKRYGAALHRLAETVDELASRVTRGRQVICHADIHPGNLIADGDGPLHVVDWDAPILAPRERDLMFVHSADFGEHPVNAHRAELFREGYGALEPDPVLLSYYRGERHLDDVAVFLGSILSPGASAEARANDLHWLTRIAEAVADPGYAP
nr:phosphotransferase [Micromonospora provocatoris]